MKTHTTDSPPAESPFTDSESLRNAAKGISPGDVAGLSARYATVREFSERLIEPLSPEDCAIQSMPDVSPTRWHLAHTTWFFETFALAATPDNQVFHPDYKFLFNSYYNAVGQQFPRPQRGLLSRPTVREVFDYREFVDAAMTNSR